MSDHLFDPGPEEVPVGISAGRKRTIRNLIAISEGRHPLMGGPTFAETCGTCHHCTRQGGVAGIYIKCRLRSTGGPATDIRLSWPSCSEWEPAA